MDPSASSPSRPALPGTAKGFIAARRARRQQLAVPPALRWTRFTPQPAGPALALQLVNDGGGAADTTVVLFTTAAVVRERVGDDGAVDAGARWDITLDELGGDPAEPVRGYVLARGGDGGWHAATVDGRSASFRSRPDELGVLRTLGLRLQLSAEPVEDALRYQPAGG